MARFLKNFDKKAGQSPGSLIFIGQQRMDEPRLRIIDYDSQKLRKEFIKEIDEVGPIKETNTTSWLNIDGLHDSELIKKVGEKFDLSSLMLEDIQDTGQRPKIEEYQDHLFITMKMLFLNKDQTEVWSEQLSAILTPNYLITFQERPGDVFEPVRNRITKPSGKIRTRGTDYLLYALLDCVLENYLKVIEKMGERIEDMEEEVLENPVPELLEEINLYRREIAYVRKAVRPVREIISKLKNLDSEIINPETMPYLRDLASLEEQAVDSAEIYKEMLADLFSTYNMAIGNKLNEIMKFLTIFATIFIPLTFLAGIYGMNFESMPELHYKYGYHVLLGVMAVVAVGMLFYFKKRKWI
ncbi:magnesium/cobalt transporter CorA [Maridesulfovibrio ferrireducens]|uniref:magnesium/cobalt transporter CorA n=1 Tax=Maridesulfovibrio ferrireducens TaxID=246191 RepID=UPI001A344EA1|nr:magnesium/cobalt transporter CorA [Maridesulfovibrio ferrireducens]MBI9112168.1 magnesium/cobalt transporter CorA [Maridesulfovibrio ferrireducens]